MRAVSLRPVSADDLAIIDRWAAGIGGDAPSRTRPLGDAADRHDPASGLLWYLVIEGSREVGTVWIERPPDDRCARLGIFLGSPSDFGRGIGRAALRLAITEFREAFPDEPIALHVRRSNKRAMRCYASAGFEIVDRGSKASPSGETVHFFTMVLPTRRGGRRRAWLGNAGRRERSRRAWARSRTDGRPVDETPPAGVPEPRGSIMGSLCASWEGAGMRLESPSCIVRDWSPRDKDAVARFCGDRTLWRNLTDTFPHACTAADMDAWFAYLSAIAEPTHWAVEAGGEAVGGIGIEIGDGVFSRSADIGYWLAEPYWGRGIMTAAVGALVPYVLARYGLCRLEAAIFAWNPASMRVLERCGFVRESVSRASVFKDGQVIDRVVYAYVDEGEG